MSGAIGTDTMHRHVVVIGMHRSGTSAVTNALAQLGLALPDKADLCAPTPFNERGNHESRRFVEFNSRILNLLGGPWSAPPAPPIGWEHSEDPEMVEIRADAQRFSSREFGEPHMVLKDPRLCITLPLWRTAFEHPPVAILVIRDPLEVARSLQVRGGCPITMGLALWHRYIQQSVLSVSGLPVFVTEYDEALRNPAQWFDVLVPFLNHHGVLISGARVEEGVRALEPELRHHRTDVAVDSAAAADETPSLLSDQRQILRILQERHGGHDEWSPPSLPPEPAWVGDVIELVATGQMVKFAYATAERELKWIKRSRVFGATKLFWRMTSTGPPLSPAPSE